jgi:beta-hydroxylase
MSRVEQVLGAVVGWNNRQVRDHALDRGQPNPRDARALDWNLALESQHAAIRSEWDAFVERGGGLPLIEDLIAEHQGNQGEWRAGLLVSRGRPTTLLGEQFPTTMRLMQQVPGLWSALWSVLAPGARLHEHAGPNAGVLRYHLGVVCPPGAALRVESTTVPYEEARGILFDDTAPHEAWNDADQPRVTLFLEVVRPMRGPRRLANAVVQRTIALDPRYREAPRRADDWMRANPNP